MKKGNSAILKIACATALSAMFLINTNAGTVPAAKKTSEDENLPIIGTYEKFVELAGDPREYYQPYYQASRLKEMDGNVAVSGRADTAGGAMAAPMPAAGMNAGTMMNDSARQSSVAAATAAPEGIATVSAESEAADYSGTNTQVMGVDEGDIVKTDGDYIYYATGGTVKIVKLLDGGKMELAGTISFDNDFSPTEMYVDGDILITIGSSYSTKVTSIADIDTSRAVEASISADIAASKVYDTVCAITVTKTHIYDISDRANAKEIRTMAADGWYVSSRKIGSSIYVVSNLSSYNLLRDEKYILPCYTDSVISGNEIPIGYDSIRYFPEVIDRNITIISGLDLSDIKNEVSVYTYFGGGNNLYVSEKNMFVASANYNETKIYKFSLDSGSVGYKTNITVSGRILNQFSMDEHDGYFRIATTSNNKEGIMSNNMYVLDSSLTVTGKIEDIAPKEKIYSVRFMGSKAYMVTFELVDPLFVIDLSDPYAPQILGALKIPGYSDYLHPYDENHLIGFGKDTTVQYDTAYYQGMKISMFDVTDLENPKEMFTEIIGTRGTASPLLTNHKALLFSKEKNILAFPVEVYEDDGTKNDQNRIKHGAFTFQGAYVYTINMEKGFNLRGKITHLTDEDYKKTGYYGGGSSYIQRIMYSGDYFYTLSDSAVKSNGISDLSEKDFIKLD